tara:strand:+ start:267 stop:1058 length:792 start_codon:yes stop_codon:yes gene_type:complete
MQSYSVNLSVDQWSCIKELLLNDKNFCENYNNEFIKSIVPIIDKKQRAQINLRNTITKQNKELDKLKEEIKKLKKENEKLKERQMIMNAMADSHIQDINEIHKNYGDMIREKESGEPPKYTIKYDEETTNKNEIKVHTTNKNKQIEIVWDYKNDKYNEYFYSHMNPNEEYNKNMYLKWDWIDYVKEKFNWSVGKRIGFSVKNISDGHFLINHRNLSEMTSEFFINETGYLYFNKYTIYKNCNKKVELPIECEYNEMYSKNNVM